MRVAMPKGFVTVGSEDSILTNDIFPNTLSDSQISFREK
jgi:hypothetical protein